MRLYLCVHVCLCAYVCMHVLLYMFASGRCVYVCTCAPMFSRACCMWTRVHTEQGGYSVEGHFFLWGGSYKLLCSPWALGSGPCLLVTTCPEDGSRLGGLLVLEWAGVGGEGACTSQFTGIELGRERGRWLVGKSISWWRCIWEPEP